MAVQDSKTKLWDHYGTIVDVGWHRNYFVRMNSGRVLVRNRRALRRRCAVVPMLLTQPGIDLRDEQADHDTAELEEPRPPQPLRRSQRTRRPRDRADRARRHLMDFQNFDEVPTLTFDRLSFYQFPVFAVPPPHRGRCTGVSTPVHSFFLLFVFLSSLSLSSVVSRLGGGDVVITIEPTRYATYV